MTGDRTPAEERRIGHSYYLGMAIHSCLDKTPLDFLKGYDYDVEAHLRDLLSFIDNECAAVAPLYDHLPDGMDMGEWVGRLVGLWAAVHIPPAEPSPLDWSLSSWGRGYRTRSEDLRQVGEVPR